MSGQRDPTGCTALATHPRDRFSCYPRQNLLQASISHVSRLQALRLRRSDKNNSKTQQDIPNWLILKIPATRRKWCAAPNER